MTRFDVFHLAVITQVARQVKKPVENRLVFIKTKETNPHRFYRFSVNRAVNLFLKKLKNFEIKNSKKTRGDFKSFDQNRIQKKIKTTRSAKFIEVKTIWFS
jgi:hypothetical protein